MKSFKQLYMWNFEKNSVKGITITNQDWELYFFEDEKDKGPSLKDRDNIHYLPK